MQESNSPVRTPSQAEWLPCLVGPNWENKSVATEFELTV